MSTSTSLHPDSVSTLDVNAVVIGVTSGPSGPVLAPGAEEVDRALGGGLAASLGAIGATGDAEEINRLPTSGALSAPLVLVVGLGKAPKGDFDPETLRRAAGAALRALAGRDRVAVALPARTDAEAEAVALGALLGNYAYLRYRTNGSRRPPVGEVVFTLPAPGAEAALRRAEALAGAVHLVRDLVNAAPCDLHPEDLAATAEEVGRTAGLEVEVLDEAALVEGGYGGIVGVGQGSANPPRLVRIAYRHPSATKTLALIGKGITFDSGGLSLKPSTSMETMKSDMGGAAAVLAAMQAIAALAPAVNVVGYLAIAENMPSGTAQRPSDVLTIYGGTTVEVLNTDAEGRLVMADALVRATEDEPDLMIDVATLTGAQMVALGNRVSAVMGNTDDARTGVTDAAGRAGESVWPMPLPPELRKSLDSTVADIANVSGERWGGMLVAGIFLKEFVPADVAWAHIDIAGPSFNSGEPYGYTPKGGTGVAARTLVQIAEDLASAAI
ncbi:MAG: leucyl aminopeptidase [Streptosporangiales bacterium]|nr:leucyl aminopeptidase [Streptosporangiales bacterium]